MLESEMQSWQKLWIGVSMNWRLLRRVFSPWVAFCCAVLLGTSQAASKEITSPQDYFVSPNQADFSDLANRWWQWIYGIPKLQNPRRDLTGTHCSAFQQGDVWFLADAETGDAIERKCQIPFGNSIFFPVINNIAWSPPEIEQSCEEVKELAAFDRSPNYIISVSVNGKLVSNPVSHLAGSSECFDLLARIPKSYNPPSYYPSATDGYWFMLRPLPVGTHDLSILAEYQKSKGVRNTLINVRYLIEVLP